MKESILSSAIQCCLLLQGSIQILVEAAVTDLRITEFLASNTGSSLVDENGDSSDWVEIYNGGDVVVDLNGCSITDDANEPTKWIFPTVLMQPNEFLIVFASGKDRDGGEELHASFKLGAGGEYLGLYDSDGTSVIFEYNPAYPPQSEDQSYGINENGDVTFFYKPSPGKPNEDFTLYVSVERGFFEEPFFLDISTPSPISTIRYTLDGREPDMSVGDTYATPIHMNTTTVLRLIAFQEGEPVSPIVTHTYILLEDVLRQPREVPGFLFEANKKRFVGNRLSQFFPITVPLDMEMDPEVVAEYRDEIVDAMTAIPTIALTSSKLYDLYVSDSALDLEVASSVELLYHDALNANDHLAVGVEKIGRGDGLKGSWRLNFRAKYGDKEWVTDVLQKTAPVNTDSAITDTFKTLILRGGHQRSWAFAKNPDATSYTLDEFCRATQVAMSGYGSHGTFVHVYLNGVYWGLYNMVERPDDEFHAAYFGGNDDDWYFTNHGGAGSTRDSSRWDYLVGPLASKDMADPVHYAELQEYLDVEQFADYILLAFYTGVTDWPTNNWYAGCRSDSSPLGPTPVQFFAWDLEYSMDRKTTRYPIPRALLSDGANVRIDFRQNLGSREPILVIWYAVFASPEFRALLDSRVAVHTSAGGALSKESAIARWDKINSFIESAIIGESARWGDCLKTLGGELSVTRTRDVDWRAQVEKIRSMLETNTSQFLDEYSELMSPDVVARFSAKVLSIFARPLSGIRNLFANLIFP